MVQGPLDAHSLSASQEISHHFITMFTTATYWPCPEPHEASPQLSTPFLSDPF
jgi:hypothetical protein